MLFFPTHFPLLSKWTIIIFLINNLSLAEQQEILYRLSDKLDLLGCLLLSGETFSDWDNTEDDVYDSLWSRRCDTSSFLPEFSLLPYNCAHKESSNEPLSTSSLSLPSTSFPIFNFSWYLRLLEFHLLLVYISFTLLPFLFTSLLFSNSVNIDFRIVFLLQTIFYDLLWI